LELTKICNLSFCSTFRNPLAGIAPFTHASQTSSLYFLKVYQLIFVFQDHDIAQKIDATKKQADAIATVIVDAIVEVVLTEDKSPRVRFGYFEVGEVIFTLPSMPHQKSLVRITWHSGK
jgi:ATP:corrinoid adenosyltransferase